MSKEALAKATGSTNLEMEPGVVHDVDRLAASANGNVLGGLLLRLRESEQLQWARRIVLILALRVMNKFQLTRSIAEKTALAALSEFHSPHCRVCNGARVFMEAQLKITCSACDGSGKERFDNDSRRAVIGTYGRRIDDAMVDLHRHMSNSLGAYLSHASARLR